MGFVLPDKVEEYALKHTSEEHPYLRHVRLWTEQHTPNPQMLSGVLVGTLLQVLVRLVKPALALDIGTFTGYSALSIASALPAGARVLTFESDEKMANVAERFIRESPWADRVELIGGDALEWLRKAPAGSAQFAFVDADKKHYPNYVRELERVLAVGGILAMDNALWSLRVLDNESTDEETNAIREASRLLAASTSFLSVLLTVRDGVVVALRK